MYSARAFAGWCWLQEAHADHAVALLARATADRVGNAAVANARKWPRIARATAAAAVVAATAATAATTVVASSTASRAPSVGLGGGAALVLGARAASALRADTSSTAAGLRRPLPDLEQGSLF